MSSTESIAIEDYYLDVLCAQLDKAYQFALALTLDPEQTYQVLYVVYHGFSKDLPLPGKDDDCVVKVFTEIWQYSQNQGDDGLPATADAGGQAVRSSRGGIWEPLAEMSLTARGIIVLADHFSLHRDDIMAILGMDETSSYLSQLAEARQQIMSHVSG